MKHKRPGYEEKERWYSDSKHLFKLLLTDNIWSKFSDAVVYCVVYEFLLSIVQKDYMGFGHNCARLKDIARLYKEMKEINLYIAKVSSMIYNKDIEIPRYMASKILDECR